MGFGLKGFVGGALPFVGSTLASMGDTAANLYSADKAEDANFKAMREENAFTSNMSSTAYRRSVADMRAAGINPMLAITQGGASTPSGSSASGGVSPDIKPVSNAFENIIKQATVKNIEADTLSKVESAATLKTQQKLNNAQAVTQATQQKLNKEMSFKAFMDAGFSLMSARNLAQLYPGLKNAADVEKTVIGKGGAYVDRITKTVGGAAVPFKHVTSGLKNYEIYDSRRY